LRIPALRKNQQGKERVELEEVLNKEYANFKKFKHLFSEKNIGMDWLQGLNLSLISPNR